MVIAPAALFDQLFTSPLTPLSEEDEKVQHSTWHVVDENPMSSLCFNPMWAERSSENRETGNGTHFPLVKIFGSARKASKNCDLVPYSLDLPTYSKSLYVRYRSANPDIVVTFQLQELNGDSQWLPYKSVSYTAETVDINTGGTTERLFRIRPIGPQRVPDPNPELRVVAAVWVQGRIVLENVVVIKFTRGGKNISSRKTNNAKATYVYIYNLYTYIQGVVGK